MPKKNAHIDKKVGSARTQVKDCGMGRYVKRNSTGEFSGGEKAAGRNEKSDSKKAATLDAFRDAYDGHNPKRH